MSNKSGNTGFQQFGKHYEAEFTRAGLMIGKGVFFLQNQKLVMAMLEKAPDIQLDRISFEEMKVLLPSLSENGVCFFICLWLEHDIVKSIAKSATERIRAKDFLEVVFSDKGLCRGDGINSAGTVKTSMILPEMEKLDLSSFRDFFTEMAVSYFRDTDVIEPGIYLEKYREEILSYKVYKKKHIPWSFVCSTDIAEAGTLVRVRSLENEAGMVVPSGDDTYIMIGIQGEVYHIDSGKFHKTYDATDEPFDIFSRMTAFIPEVSLLPGEEFVSIDDIARICYPKAGNGIYARQLENRTKVFPEYDKDNYFLGVPGDYLAIRKDDLKDMYIIQKDIFGETYEEEQTQ